MAEILNQDEVDLLLNAVTSGGEYTEPETASAGSRQLQMAAYDFRRPERVSKEQLKGLQSLFDAFSRELSILFPPFLRTVVRVDLVSIDQLTYDEFILSVSRPTALVIVDMAPLDGTAVIEMSPTMIFPIVDRVLGGQGKMVKRIRELTEIESRIIQRITLMMLDALRRSWAQLIEFDLGILQLESDPLIVQIVAGSEMVVLVGYEVHIGESTGSMNFCIPLMVLNPVLTQISEQAHFTRTISPEVQERTRRTITRLIQRAEVPVDAVLGHATLTLGDILDLRQGDIISLDTAPTEPVAVYIGGHKRFYAQAGKRGEQSSIQLVAFSETE